MYVKSMLTRIKGAPSKAWTDWKVFRNYPGMEYRDVHEIIPKSFLWKYPSQGSIKYENSHFNVDYFKWDYKLPYRSSPYFNRKVNPPTTEKTYLFHHFKEEELTAQDSSNPGWREKFCRIELVSHNTDNITLQEKHDTYYNMIKDSFENEDIYNTCTLFFKLVTSNNGEKMINIYESYFQVYDNYGTDKNVDPSDMDSKWLQIYFDNLQSLYDYEVIL
jgi:hypothetical protein